MENMPKKRMRKKRVLNILWQIYLCNVFTNLHSVQCAHYSALSLRLGAPTISGSAGIYRMKICRFFFHFFFAFIVFLVFSLTASSAYYLYIVQRSRATRYTVYTHRDKHQTFDFGKTERDFPAAIFTHKWETIRNIRILREKKRRKDAEKSETKRKITTA